MDIDVVGDAKADGDGAGKVGADQAKTLMMSLDVGSIYVPDPELVYREVRWLPFPHERYRPVPDEYCEDD